MAFRNTLLIAHFTLSGLGRRLGLKDQIIQHLKLVGNFNPPWICFPQTALPYPTWNLESKDNYQLGTRSKDKNKSPALPAFPLRWYAFLWLLPPAVSALASPLVLRRIVSSQSAQKLVMSAGILVSECDLILEDCWSYILLQWYFVLIFWIL